ncbi:hypothetical protein MUA02_15325 [Enterobacteriaceae bacterium H20N1]|uniref:PEGA domain-containing protein n=1 Tax=Dryocola boscaweniae TaxID=2925397 RepID=A0A9X2W9E4_9ENTR|nr:hypothetical protein [Dryocola boscaweniae]MCT4703225.1 hypothetical protein [Dryocola boscaweniae]MCT4720393.1 hypothetical protein [Dryocola boscaweniae]
MKKFICLLLLPLLLTGCAAIVGNGEETVFIDSTPANVPFMITDNEGQITAIGTTPQSVTLRKSDGGYFGKQAYTLTLKQEGYYSASMPLEYRFSRWYTFGNIIFFGVPGWLIVDPFFGGMYTFKEDKIHTWMRPCERGPFNYMCS